MVSWNYIANGASIKSSIEASLRLSVSPKPSDVILVVGKLCSTLDLSSIGISSYIALDVDGVFDYSNFNSSLRLPNIKIDLCVVCCWLSSARLKLSDLKSLSFYLSDCASLFYIDFNPFSLLLLGKLYPSLKNSYPWSYTLYSSTSVTRQLSNLDFNVLSAKHMVFHHLLTKYSNTSSFESFCCSNFSIFGSIYFISANKSILTPVVDNKGKSGIIGV